ncbi:hypothetical protein [Castellaniella sp. GW247-6E4]|uniref:hypothetical protein n=1 Tax=Castellaniella sp. GW247-6E4 TaxID=3140380 RepID=UPI0033151DFA
MVLPTVDVMPIIRRNPALLRKARFLDLCFDFLVGASRYRVTVDRGDIRVRPAGRASGGAFELQASESVWQAYASPDRKPQYHDIIALIESGHLDVTGDMLLFFRNLFLIKGVMAAAWRADASW